MSVLKVGVLGVAHLHVNSYVHNLQKNDRAEIVGVWDHESPRAADFSADKGLRHFLDIEDLLANCDAVAICSENTRHTELVEIASRSGKHIICEKPLVTDRNEADRMRSAVEKAKVIFMTAFPCRFSPAWQRIKSRISGGEMGKILAICATNRGTCPGGWFTEKEHSGGGAMIDHVVHVTDLLRDLLGSEVVRVQAQTGNNTYGQSWEDTAMVTLEFSDGVFATLDSSWSRPTTYKTWGDVTMNIVCEKGVIELDMFGQSIDQYSLDSGRHSVGGFGSDLDGAMFDSFVRSCLDGEAVKATLEDGLAAALVAISGYESVSTSRVASVAKTG